VSVLGYNTYLKARRDINCTLKSTVLEFFHRKHGKSRIHISQQGRWLTVARDGETAIRSQMNAYLLFLETWKLKGSGDILRLRLIAYLYAVR
jgi:hypothetical protein